MPNLWEDLCSTHGLSEHWNRFVRLKNKFSLKHCGSCGHTGAGCCHTDQMLHRLPDEMRPRIYSMYSIRHKCTMLIGNRCAAENFKPLTCIQYFCGKLGKTFKAKNTRFIGKFTGILMQLASLYYEPTDRRSWDGGWSILLKAYFERNPDEHSRFMRHIEDTLGTEIMYPPVIRDVPSLLFQRIDEMTTCSIPETGSEPYIPLWEI